MPSDAKRVFSLRKITGIPLFRSLFLNVRSFVATGHFHCSASRTTTSSWGSFMPCLTWTTRHFWANLSANEVCLRIFGEPFFAIVRSSCCVIESRTGSNCRFKRFISSSNMSRLNCDGIRRKFESRMTLRVNSSNRLRSFLP